MSEKSDSSSATASERGVGSAPHVGQAGAGSKDIEDNGGGGETEVLPSPRIVENGLLVKIRGITETRQPFSYALAPYSAQVDPEGIGWTTLSTSNVGESHVRCHVIDQYPPDGTELQKLIYRFKAEHAVAVIVINQFNNLHMDCLKTLTKIPVLVVASSTKDRLQELASHEKGALCKVFPTAPTSEELMSPLRKAGQRMGSPSVSPADLPKDVLLDVKRKLFFKGPKSPMDNPDIFKTVMSLLSAYELMPQEEREGESRLQPGRLCQKLRKRIQKHTTLKKDFVFYFVLANRLLQTYLKNIYTEETAVFATFLCEAFLKLEDTEIVEIFRKFADSDNYKVEMSLPDPGATIYSIDVFTLFANACLTFIQRFQTLHFKMIIVSMYLIMMDKLQAEERKRADKLQTDEPKRVWKRYLIQETQDVVLDEAAISDIKQGLKSVALFQLPEPMAFDEILMADLFFSEGRVNMKTRPFKHFRAFLQAIVPYVNEELKFTLFILHDARISYKCLLDVDRSKKRSILIELSDQHDELGAVEEGLEVLDEVITIKQKKGWTQHELNGEILEWLKFLLSMVDVLQPCAPDCLKAFTCEKFLCCNQNQKFLREQVITMIESNLRLLSAERFYPIYKALTFLTNEFLLVYTTVYDVEHFGLELTEKGWRKLLKLFCDRYKAAQYHKFLLDFFMSVADWYSKKYRPHEFFLDLLKLHVPTLFFEEKNDLENPQSLRSQFHDFLEKYYSRVQKQCSISDNMGPILECVSDEREDHFQDTVLQILAQATVHEIVQSPQDVQTVAGLATVVGKIQLTGGIFDDPQLKQKFCWSVVGPLCKELPSATKFGLFHPKFKNITTLIGPLFEGYCQRLDDSKGVINLAVSSKLPVDLENAQPQTRAYFEWVQDIQSFSLRWKNKLTEKKVNYGEIQRYQNHYSGLEQVLLAVGCQEFIYDRKNLEDLSSEFDLKRGKVNNLLIHTVHEPHQTLWCNVASVFSEYGVSFPKDITELIEQNVVFPRGKEGKLQTSTSHPSFQSMESISIKLELDTSLRTLTILHERLEMFFRELQGFPLEFFIFFRLHHSSLFDMYLRLHIQSILKEILTAHKPQALHILPPGYETAESPQTEVTVLVLKEAITKTQDTVSSLIQGRAKYRDIVAGGVISLDSINTEWEFSVLEKSTRTLGLQVENLEGLSGVKCMLELFKASTHITTLQNIFHRYHLEKCERDPKFVDLTTVTEVVRDSKQMESLTPNEATQKLQIVKDHLAIEKDTSVDSLDFLEEVYKSREFHKFLLQRRFYGDQGHKAFRQKYELITAQLQNKGSDFEEQILNQLFPAFQFISPFVVPVYDGASARDQPSFSNLVSSMWKLDRKNGPIQLRNVYKNIHLIHQWFAKVQGDTAKSIEMELDDIMSTGQFVFTTETAQENATPSMCIVLEFTRSAGLPLTESITVLKERWYERQISEFVTRLGFLSQKEASGVKAKTFLHINEVAHLCHELVVKIKQFGHFVSAELPCSITPEEANTKLEFFQNMLTEGRTTVSTLQSKYHWLLYMSGARVSIFYDLLRQRPPHLEQIVKEVIFLSPHIIDGKKSKASITRTLEICKTKFVGRSEDTSLATPMEFVGFFLQSVYDELGVYTPQKEVVSSQSRKVLHYTPGYSQDQLMKLLLELYHDNIPESYEVLKCYPSCTENELSLFFDRVNGVSSVYTVVGVNDLPFTLQEYVVERTLQSEKESWESILHYVETKPSALRDVLDVQEHSISGSEMGKRRISEVFSKRQERYGKSIQVELVCGEPGDGKSHYIQNKLHMCSFQVTIPVNESFSVLSVVKKLRLFPLNTEASESEVCGIFFNFTMCYPKESLNVEDVYKYDTLMDKIGWFFFQLLVLGSVEDSTSGCAFQLHKNAKWEVYIEVPASFAAQSKDYTSAIQAVGICLQEFQQLLPIFQYVGRPVLIGTINDYLINAEVQLVCKYLKAYDSEMEGPSSSKTFGGLFRKKPPIIARPSLWDDLPPEECLLLLKKHMPPHVAKKISQRMFVRYMYRRCKFLKMLPDLEYSPGIVTVPGSGKNRHVVDTSRLFSTLLSLMLEEVNVFTSSRSQGVWSKSIKHQLIYEVDRHGGASVGIITPSLDKIKTEQKNELERIGIKLPSQVTLHSRDYLVDCLSRSLNVPKDDCMKVLDRENYVLTLDFTMKMLSINERRVCGIPVVLEGETGVGKTALVEILSKLWNYSQEKWIQLWKERFVDFINGKLHEFAHVDAEAYGKAIEIIKTGYAGCVEDDISYIARLPIQWEPSIQFFTKLKEYILKEKHETFWNLIIPHGTTATFSSLLEELEKNGTLEKTIEIANAFLNSKLLQLFHKLPIHAALTPDQINGFFQPIFESAKELESAFQLSNSDSAPVFVIFLDELNTSSCGGVLKEIIVDSSLNGVPIPSNIFIVGACNPHRGNSLALLDSKPEIWARGSYYVRPLHPSLRFLVWDYGALDKDEEREYVTAKLTLAQKNLPSPQKHDSALYGALTELIVQSQENIRESVFHFLRENIDEEKDLNIAEIASKSCVSQRDIQRVITFYNWLLQLYSKFSPHGKYEEKQNDYQRRAVLVSLGIVYYLRLPEFYRKQYSKMVNETIIYQQVDFSKAFQDDLDWMIQHIIIPPGIAITRALKENLFAMVACICTKTPLIIVGEPGSSKTLSFHLAAESLRGNESVSDILKETDVFPSVDPYFHQCSRSTTSNDIITVFERALKRQETLNLSIDKKHCVVFMDEAGLPEESHESLKALHYYLDKSSVSFVAISNHVLDAAKTNRAISVVRMEVTVKELETLAKGCLCDSPDNVPLEKKKEISSIVKFCSRYVEVIKEDYKKFFGLRDFVHFLHYLRRQQGQSLTTRVVLHALERNFNGHVSFQNLVLKLMEGVVKDDPSKVLCENARSIIDILQESLLDCPSGDNPENAVRYKLIIDPSKDNSLIRYLFKFGVVEKENTRMFMCSDVFGDQEVQKVSIVSAICHSVTEGHTVILSQTNEINESFYDLFNLRYRCIDDPSQGRLYFANVAIGAYIKPCPVNPMFQCVVLLQEADVPNIPVPFLNRFEKYHITYDNVLESALRKLPHGWKSLMIAAGKKVSEFAGVVEKSSSLYGYQEETISSLLLLLLPAKPNFLEHTCSWVHHSTEPDRFLLESVVNLMKDIGFHIPHTIQSVFPWLKLALFVQCSEEDFQLDVKSLFVMIGCSARFDEYTNSLSDDSAMSAMKEALDALNSDDTLESEETDSCQLLSVGACLIVSIILQWTIRHLCKTLMQVMTPEALIKFQDYIPSSYVRHYLEHQEHFSLERLIALQYRSVQATKQGSCALPCTKMLVFCRTSALIADLPFVKIKSGASMSVDPRSPTSDCLSVSILNVSTYHSERSFLDKLHHFYGSGKDHVLILKMNMQESSIKSINHVRMIIEDVENQNAPSDKIAVVLLDFPSSMFSEGGYPSLFQTGWSHYYLDSVSINEERCAVNTEQWLKQCCFANDYFTHGIRSSLEELLQQSMPSIPPLLATKLQIHTCVDPTSHHSGGISSQIQFFKQLLEEKGFGKILSSKFLRYWDPPLFAAYLQKAATITYRRESSVSMTVVIQNLIHGKFVEFITYIVSVMVDSQSLHVIFEPNCPSPVLALFQEVVSTMDAPEFSKLRQLNIIHRSVGSKTLKHEQWLFPFYGMLSRIVDAIILECIQEVNEQTILEASDEIDAPAENTSSTETEVAKCVMKFHGILVSKEEGNTNNQRCLAVALRCMGENEDILQRYFSDFISDKFAVKSVKTGIVVEILQEYFAKLEPHLEECQTETASASSEQLSAVALPKPAMKVISYHLSYHHHKSTLANILPIIKQLDELQCLTIGLKQESFPRPHFTSYSENALALLGNPASLSAYIIDLLFSTVVHVWMKNEFSLQWFNFYQRMITSLRVKEILYESMTPLEEGKLNIMHTAYVMLNCDLTDSTMKNVGYAAFWSLYNKYFFELKLKDSENWPQLGECAFVVLEALEGVEKDLDCMEDAVQGLLEHFFSEHRCYYHEKDIQWLLKLANEEMKWKHNPVKVFTDSSSTGITLGVIKHYLLRILHQQSSPDKRTSAALAIFNPENRTAIGAKLLSSLGEEAAVQYTPYFYEITHAVMPPLAHIYFLLVLETLSENRSLNLPALREETHKISELNENEHRESIHWTPYVKMMQTLPHKLKFSNSQFYIQRHQIVNMSAFSSLTWLLTDNQYQLFQSFPPQCYIFHLADTILFEQMLSASASRSTEFDGVPGEKHLLVIEQQALIQLILERYAEATVVGRSDYMRAQLKVDTLLSEASSSDVMSHHGTVLAMHLMNYGKNLSKFRQHVQQLYSNGIACLELQRDAVRQPVPASLERPVLLAKKQYAQLFGLYQKVCEVMEALRNSKTSADTNTFARKLLHGIPEKWHVSSLCLQPGGASLKSNDCLKMLMWLAAYYQFYLKRISFPVLINIFKEKRYLELESAEIKLFELLLQNTAQYDTSGTILHKLFFPVSRKSQDQTEAEMRDCIVNVVAVVFGSPPESNHLWYHLMQPKELNETFLTGFMYQAPVSSKSGLCYEDGIHLTENGTYGKYAYTADGGKRALTLPSLYVLLWINLAAIGMALYTKKATKNDVLFVCDGKQSPEAFTSEHLTKLWKHMTVNIDICDEHVTHLVADCLSGLLKISCGGDIATGGIFKTCEDLAVYEKAWQERVFKPAYSSLSHELSAQLKDSSVMKDIISMKRRYPKQLTYNDLAYMLQAAPEVQERIKVLSQFVLEYPRLHVGSSLLTDLIHLYQWLHRELAHTMTMETARKLTVANLNKQLSRNCPEKFEEYDTLFQRVAKKYNRYVSLTGRHKGTRAGKKHHLISNKNFVVDLLSSEVPGKDCLFTIIDDIISSHRHLLECLSQTASSSNGLERYTATQYETLPPTLISPGECIINQEELGFETASLKMLMRKQSCYLRSSHGPDEGIVLLEGHQVAHAAFNALQLQEDVVATYLAGKAMIDSANYLRTPFSFVSSESTSKQYPDPELAHLSQQLNAKFQKQITTSQLRIMEREFHSADFEAYQGIISFLTTAVCILVNALQNGDKKNADLETLLLRPFLQSEQQAEDFFTIEMKRCRLTKAQVKYIEEIQLCYLFSTLLTFAEWNKEGMYDFHMLPFAMKGKMHTEDIKVVESMQDDYQDRHAEFLRDLKLLEAALVHLQSQIIKIVDENPQVPITDLIDKKQNPSARHIPDSVSIHHYVSLRLILRRLMLSIQTSRHQHEDSDDLSEKWQEWDSNPWKTHLHCTMQSSLSVSFSAPDLGNFGFTARDVTAIEQMGETFECHSDTASESTTVLHKEFMSELKSLEILDESIPMEYPDLQVIPGKSMAQYDVDEVCQFLGAIGLSQCVEWAKREEITGDLLVEESEKTNLSGIGLDNSFHRLKLLVCLKRQATGISDLAKEYPPTKVTEFLSTMGKEFEDYVDVTEENGLDGEMLYLASEEALNDLGIKKAVHRAILKHKFCSKIDGQSDLSEQFPPEKVCEVLIKVNLQASIPFVIRHRIDGDIVSKASDDLLNEMGIKTKGQMRKLRGEFKGTQ